MTGARAGGVDLEGLLGRARKLGDAAEVYFLRHRDEPVLFEANRLKLVEARESAGVALRIVKDGRVGLCSTTRLDDMDGLLSNALELVPFGPEAKLAFPPLREFDPVEVYDSDLERLTLEDMIQLGQSAIDRLRAGAPDLVCDASVGKGVTTMTVLNSEGGYGSYTKSGCSAFVRGTIVEDTDMLFVSDGENSCRPIRDVSAMVSSVERQLELSRTVCPPPVGQVPVVFTPKGVGGGLIGPLMAGFGGKTVLQGASPLVGKLGESLLDPRVSVWDDPTYPYSPGSRMCDDEGIPARVIPLVNRGVVANFLYDLQTAAQAGTVSTGSAHRGLASFPSPGPSVIMVGEGDVAWEDIISDMGDGLVVERLLGAGQSNVLGGDFNANVLLGYRVSEGRVIGRVKDTVISGNVYSALNQVRSIENISYWVGGSLKTPAICVNGVSVATKEGA